MTVNHMTVHYMTVNDMTVHYMTVHHMTVHHMTVNHMTVCYILRYQRVLPSTLITGAAIGLDDGPEAPLKLFCRLAMASGASPAAAMGSRAAVGEVGPPPPIIEATPPSNRIHGRFTQSVDQSSIENTSDSVLRDPTPVQSCNCPPVALCA